MKPSTIAAKAEFRVALGNAPALLYLLHPGLCRRQSTNGALGDAGAVAEKVTVKIQFRPARF
jgi:hypothetical protein